MLLSAGVISTVEGFGGIGGMVGGSPSHPLQPPTGTALGLRFPPTAELPALPAVRAGAQSAVSQRMPRRRITLSAAGSSQPGSTCSFTPHLPQSSTVD